MNFYDFRIAPLAAFAFLVFLYRGFAKPLRRQQYAQLPRVLRNLIFSLPAFLVMRLALVPIPYGAALWAQEHNFGVLHHLPIPFALQVLAGVIWADYAYYWWHIATHRVPLLWRFHLVHHADEDMDSSTAARFHFGELMLSVAFRVAFVTVAGMPAIAVLIFEGAFEIAAQFHHSNWRLPLWFEATLSKCFITPRLHGIHHSVKRDEMDSNWGTIFSLWDKIHRSRRDDIAQNEIVIGVPDLPHEHDLTIGELWLMPFRKQ